MLDWEEHTFVGLRALYRRVFMRPAQRARDAVRATLAGRRQSLLLLAQALAGKPLALFETGNAQLCAEGRVFLPPEFSIATTREANAELFTLKTVFAALAMRQGWLKDGGIPLPDLVRRCADELPGLDEKIAAVRAALPPDADLWQLMGTLPSPSRAASVSAQVLDARPEAPPAQAVTEITGQGQAEVEVIAIEHLDNPGAEMPEHVFEKVESIEEYQGTPRKTDDDDALKDHEEALRELEMRQLLRTAERPRSIYRSDVILDGLSLEVGDDTRGPGIPYPEWDHRRGGYRADWCRVQAGRATRGDAAWVGRTAAKHRALLHRLRRQFATLRSEFLRQRRQPLGPEFDLDAVINAEVLRRVGGAPGELIYTDVRRDLHDIAALVLLDQSYSTDAWLNNERVLDLITETIFCVGEVLGDAIEKLAIAGFSSNTRRSCRFELRKDFTEPWSQARARLGTLEPAGYTRIGPALRHAQELLAREPARRKIILLITDGRPCDYDRYEGAYGIQDVKKAIETGRQHGIQTHAFAVEKQAAEFFPAMFTRHSYDIIPNPARLTESMCRVFSRLLRD
ncbi:MAG: VWA domain-containing protein [Verrucomicrobiaceae bacterium]|nr:VWA domain-containing protein [Verrucomicrobiaceae bacterium]